MLAIRVPLSILWAGVLSVAMFYVLERLIAVHQEYRSRPAVQIQYTRKRVDTPVEPRRQTEVRRTPPRVVPPGPGIDIEVGPPAAWSEPPTVIRIGGPSHGHQHVELIDRDAQPLVRVEPDYPLRAREQGIEGWVQVQFTVTATGSVRDPKVVAAEPPGVFDAAALKAVARWRYAARIANGEAVERVGLQTVLRFALER